MLTRPASFLLMDEPTNHLDIPSREILTDALEAYRGTICFITHDRTLIRDVANKIIEIQEGRIKIFPGTYDDYLYRRETPVKDVSETLRIVKRSAPAGSQAKIQQRQRKVIEGNLRNRHYREISPVRKRIADIEIEVSKNTERLNEVEALLADPAHYKEGRKVVETNMEYSALKDSLKSLTDEWDRLTVEVEKMERDFRDAMNDIDV